MKNNKITFLLKKILKIIEKKIYEYILFFKNNIINIYLIIKLINILIKKSNLKMKIFPNIYATPMEKNGILLPFRELQLLDTNLVLFRNIRRSQLSHLSPYLQNALKHGARHPCLVTK